MTTPSRRATQGKDQQVLKGIAEELQTVPTLFLGARTFTPQSLADYVQHHIDLANAVVTARAGWSAAIDAYDAASKDARFVLSDLRHFVIALFGPGSPRIATFGFSPPRRATRTPEQAAAAALKAKATREARRTLSPKQKARIKGAPEPSPPEPAAAIPAPAVDLGTHHGL